MWEKNCFKLQWVCVWEREGWREKRERKWEGEKRKREDGKYLKILKLFNIFFENSKSPSSLSFLKCCIFISVVIFLVSLWDFFKCCICPWIIIHPENCQWWLAENTPQYAAYFPKKKKEISPILSSFTIHAHNLLTYFLSSSDIYYPTCIFFST